MSCGIWGRGAETEHSFGLGIEPTHTAGLHASTATGIGNGVGEFDAVNPVQRSYASQAISVEHSGIVCAVQDIHAHELHRVIPVKFKFLSLRMYRFMNLRKKRREEKKKFEIAF